MKLEKAFPTGTFLIVNHILQYLYDYKKTTLKKAAKAHVLQKCITKSEKTHIIPQTIVKNLHISQVYTTHCKN